MKGFFWKVLVSRVVPRMLGGASCRGFIPGFPSLPRAQPRGPAQPTLRPAHHNSASL